MLRLPGCDRHTSFQDQDTEVHVRTWVGPQTQPDMTSSVQCNLGDPQNRFHHFEICNVRGDRDVSVEVKGREERHRLGFGANDSEWGETVIASASENIPVQKDITIRPAMQTNGQGVIIASVSGRNPGFKVRPLLLQVYTS